MNREDRGEMDNGSPRRVLYLESSRGGVVGGSLTGLQHLLRGLDRRQYEPIVVLYEDKALRHELEALGIRVRIFDTTRPKQGHPLQKVEAYQRLRQQPAAGRLIRPLRDARIFLRETVPAAFSLARLFKQEQPQLIHCCNNFQSNLDGIVAAWLSGISCVCHVKGFERYTWVGRAFARSVALGICMTEAVREHCERQKISARRMAVIYDGLDVEGFQPTQQPAAIRKELGIPLEAPLVGIAGNIQHWKGQAVVVEAIREAKTVLPDVRCLIVGGVHRNGTAYAQDLHRFVEAHRLQEHVIFTGFRDDVADLLATMDVVIHASVKPEPFGRVILEGMALGKPVIATNIGGVPEFVEDGVHGRLVPPGEPQVLAQAIVELCRDVAYRQRLGNNGREAVRQRFAMQHHVKKITDAYGALGAGPPSCTSGGTVPKTNGVMERYNGTIQTRHH